jgi:photosystem II stability/assembly factor-like uncharacterized protein
VNRTDRVFSIAYIFLCGITAATLAQSQVKIAYECSEADVDAFGLTCSSDRPCAVYLEISSVEGSGNRIFATGNLHTSDRTLYSLLLMSDDNGLTWNEPHTRIRSAALEQVQFLDLQTGWISGESVDPLPRNPFFLLTTDGGRTWRQRPVFDDTKVGSVSQFYFVSKSAGQFILDASRGKNIRQELYESNTGGESWEMKQTSNAALHLASAKPASTLTWRARADAASGAYRLERGGGREWESVASFPIHVADCK